MKKSAIIFILLSLFVLYSCLIQKSGKQALYDLKHSQGSFSKKDSFSIINPGLPETGNAEAGYQYLLHGDAFNTGIPMDMYKKILPSKNTMLLSLAGYNKHVLNDFVVFKNGAGKLTATVGCLQCHSQKFNDQLIIGLGNSFSNFQTDKTEQLKLAERIIKLLYGKKSDEWKTAEQGFQSSYTLSSLTITEMQGPAPAHRIAEVMASHRDPQTLEFRKDTNYFFIPPEVIPSDIPALWAIKKKQAFHINAMGQGNFLTHLMSPSILTIKDTAEARKIYNKINDVWAYISTLQPPAYPYSINQKLSEEGKLLFEENCSGCHGVYDKDGYYPNKLIPANIIGTDSLMLKYYSKYNGYAEWFNKSWFATASSPAFIKPQPGYVAPPLDGVWITAPYFHNGSVPTVEAVLNSEIRSRYWKRNFSKVEYDYENLGWQYKTLPGPGGKKTYNTDIPGYGNYGHYFGDHLNDRERKAVIEYLKTL